MRRSIRIFPSRSLSTSSKETCSPPDISWRSSNMHIKDFYENINQLSGDRFSILETAIRTFTEKQAAQASAGLAYYTFFSIFPLILAFVAGGSYFIDSHQVFNTVTQFIQQALPISRQVINENLEEILEERGTAGIISFLILLWSASGDRKSVV